MPACADGAIEEGAGEGEGEGEADPADIPPTDVAALESWIQDGQYLGWACEDVAHAPRAPSPHPRNRICSNPLLSTSTAAAALPVGAASVKEIYAAAGDDIVAYAVMVKVGDGDETDADSVYYYEGDLAAAPAANGTGGSGGVAQTVCFDCHSHGPEAGGQEHFFTIVR